MRDIFANPQWVTPDAPPLIVIGEAVMYMVMTVRLEIMRDYGRQYVDPCQWGGIRKTVAPHYLLT